jgi:hypothetical protein
MKRSDVVALYVDPRGPYPKLLEQWWDEQRDARLYDGPLPVVAHPPCGNYGSLRHLAAGNDGDCAPRAVEQVRRWGGVLEHPATSTLWAHCGMPAPGEFPDRWGGISVEVQQCDWGHVARKRTRLYLVGISSLPPAPPAGSPTHWCSGSKRPGARGETPPGIKVCSVRQRRRTPVDFARWLIDVAARTRRVTESRDTV